MQLLTRHGLQCHGEVEGRDGDLRDLLERQKEVLLCDLDIVDSYTGDGEVRVGFGDVIPHVDVAVSCCRDGFEMSSSVKEC